MNKYGESGIDLCPFCKKNATTKNSQEIPVCYSHKKSIIRNLTCFCGDSLEPKDGKYGPYFTCINCGNISLKKALLMNPEFKSETKKEITITSDKVDAYYS